MPCRHAAPVGLTSKQNDTEAEVTKPGAFKHFVQREKKHAMAQVCCGQN